MQEIESDNKINVLQDLKSVQIYNKHAFFYHSTVWLASFFFTTLIWFKVDTIDLLFITASVFLAWQTVKVMASVGRSTVH